MNNMKLLEGMISPISIEKGSKADINKLGNQMVELINTSTAFDDEKLDAKGKEVKANFLNAVDSYNNVYIQPKKFEDTPAINDLESEGKSNLAALVALTRSRGKSKTAGKKEAADRVLSVIKGSEISSNDTKEDFAARAKVVVTVLTTTRSADVATLGIGDEVADLQESSSQLFTLIGKRDREASGRKKMIKPLQAKNKVKEALNDLAWYVNTALYMGKTEQFGKFADDANSKMQRIKNGEEISDALKEANKKKAENPAENAATGKENKKDKSGKNSKNNKQKDTGKEGKTDLTPAADEDPHSDAPSDKQPSGSGDNQAPNTEQPQGSNAGSQPQGSNNQPQGGESPQQKQQGEEQPGDLKPAL
jgi:hypothetical protein